MKISNEEKEKMAVQLTDDVAKALLEIDKDVTSVGDKTVIFNAIFKRLFNFEE